MSETMPTLFVSSCGTSLLTNAAPLDLMNLLKDTANDIEKEIAPYARQTIDSRLEQQRQRLADASTAEVRQLSAELNGIIGAYSGRLPVSCRDQHVLLHTDTYQGSAVAHTLCDWLVKQGMVASPERIPGLTTRSIDAFRLGVTCLIKWCEETLPGYREQKYRIVFNLTGGFKSIQGYLQSLGMFYADEMVYVFETGKEILRIPRLPLKFEESVVASIRDHLDVFRRLQFPGASLPTARCRQVPETFLYELGDEVELSPWGTLVWERNRKTIYQQAILTPLSSKLRLSSQARDAADKLPADRRMTFNERMDDLSHYLESGRKECTKRLDFKQLKSNPKPPSTHECDLWADRGAWRAFGHFENDTFIVDSIGPGLH